MKKRERRKSRAKMRLDDECRECLYSSHTKRVEGESDEEKKREFIGEARRLCDEASPLSCAPLLARDLNALHERVFSRPYDFSREKRLFDDALLSMEDALWEEMQGGDILKNALAAATAANYIDFARIPDLEADAVEYVLDAAKGCDIDSVTLELFKEKLSGASTLVFLHDNCGEIVCDKLLVRAIKSLYPNVSVTSVVRGGPILNDATAEDVAYVGLDEHSRVISSGAAVPGTPLREVSEEVLSALRGADVIVSKGLGNLETICGEGYPAFHCFCAKCRHISERFSLPLWSGGFRYIDG